MRVMWERILTRVEFYENRGKERANTTQPLEESASAREEKEKLKVEDTKLY